MKKIRPHKGGRTEPIKFRVTPEEKQMIDLARLGDSYADFFVKLTRKQLKKV